MSLFSDIWAAFKRQAAKTQEGDSPTQAAQELSQDLAEAIETNQPPGGIYGGSGNIPVGGTVATIGNESLSFGLGLNAGKLKITDETGAATDLEVTRQSTAVKFDSPNKQVTLEATTAANIIATDNGAKSPTWTFHQEGWEKHPQLTADPSPNPSGTGQEYFNTVFQRVRRWQGSAWRNKEPLYFSLPETDRGAVVADGLGKRFFVVPAEWNGMRITAWTVRCPGGTGDLNAKISKNGAAGTNIINVDGTAAVSTGASVDLATGDTISVEVQINTTGLQGLSATFKVE